MTPDEDYKMLVHRASQRGGAHGQTDALLAIANRVDQVLDLARCEHFQQYGPHDAEGHTDA